MKGLLSMNLKEQRRADFLQFVGKRTNTRQRVNQHAGFE